MLTFTTTPRTELIRGSSFEDYRGAEGLNQSLMKDHDEAYSGCPALYRFHALQPDDTDTIARREGRAFHCLLLEPKTFRNRYRTLDAATEEEIFQKAKADAIAAKKKTLMATSSTLAEFREKRGKGFERTQAFLDWAGADSREIVSAEFSTRLDHMIEAIHRNKEVMDELAGVTLADCEVSAFFTLKIEGEYHLQFKARFDIIAAGDVLLDAKTCRSTNARKFAGAVAQYGYDIQGAHYIMGGNANKLCKRRYGFLAAEKEAPFLNCIHWLPEDWLKYARIRHRKISLDIAENIRANRWPGPGNSVLMPPSYLENEIEALAA